MFPSSPTANRRASGDQTSAGEMSHSDGDDRVSVVRSGPVPAQIAAVAMAGGLTVDQLARLPFSFPTYAGVLARAATLAAWRLGGGADRPPPAVGS